MWKYISVLYKLLNPDIFLHQHKWTKITPHKGEDVRAEPEGPLFLPPRGGYHRTGENVTPIARKCGFNISLHNRVPDSQKLLEGQEAIQSSIWYKLEAKAILDDWYHEVLVL